ncbi:MAG: ATP-binding protein, partial [Acidobacteriaceae bacterium]
ADPDQIEQLLINLVRNAVEAAMFPLDLAEPPTPTPSTETAPEAISAGKHSSPGAAWTASPSSVFQLSPEGDLTPAAVTESADRPATPPHVPEVTIRALEDGDLVAIQIEDNGPGLANPENLFVPLYTTKKSGSGVGLALARQIVEAHGGAITLRNRTDCAGCIAEVRMPRAERARP